MKHVIIKLVNGEEIVGKVDPEEMVSSGLPLVRVRQPLVVRVAALGDAIGIILSHYERFAKSDTISIFADKIVYMEEIFDEMIEYYQESVRYHSKESQDKFRKSIAESAAALRKIVNEGVQEGDLFEDISDDPIIIDDDASDEAREKAFKNILDMFNTENKKPS